MVKDESNIEGNDHIKKMMSQSKETRRTLRFFKNEERAESPTKDDNAVKNRPTMNERIASVASKFTFTKSNQMISPELKMVQQLLNNADAYKKEKTKVNGDIIGNVNIVNNFYISPENNTQSQIM